MSITPVFDATVKASDPDLHKASTIFPQPSTHWSFAPVDPRYYGKVTGDFSKARITSKPEPKWRTFLRCLLWWLP